MMPLSKKRAYLLTVSSQRLFAQAQVPLDVTVTVHTQGPPGTLQYPWGLEIRMNWLHHKAHAAHCAEF